jgi:hypothetical protein
MIKHHVRVLTRVYEEALVEPLRYSPRICIPPGYSEIIEALTDDINARFIEFVSTNKVTKLEYTAQRRIGNGEFSNCRIRRSHIAMQCKDRANFGVLKRGKYCCFAKRDWLRLLWRSLNGFRVAQESIMRCHVDLQVMLQ